MSTTKQLPIFPGNTVALLDRLKVAKALRSDYAAAKFLGVTATTVYAWRRGERTMDETTALQIADALGLDPIAVMAEVRQDRPQTARERKVWERHRPRISLAVVAALAVSGWMMFSEPAKASTSQNAEKSTVYNLYIMRNYIRGISVRNATPKSLCSSGSRRPDRESR